MHGVNTRSDPDVERRGNGRPAERKHSGSSAQTAGLRTSTSWVKLRARNGFGKLAKREQVSPSCSQPYHSAGLAEEFPLAQYVIAVRITIVFGMAANRSAGQHFSYFLLVK
jgi:hypothetical protein